MGVFFIFILEKSEMLIDEVGSILFERCKKFKKNVLNWDGISE